VEKLCYNKRDDLEDKVKHLKGDMFIVYRPVDNFIFEVRTSQPLLSHSAKKKWVVDSGCTHHMDNELLVHMVG
jgi:hypothetical protein